MFGKNYAPDGYNEREREREKSVSVIENAVKGDENRRVYRGAKATYYTHIELIRFHGLDNGRSKSRVTIII